MAGDDDIPIPNRIVAELLNYKKSGTVLDLGVGWGRNALFLASSGFDVSGIDIDSKAIELFRKKAADAGISVRAELADVQKYNIAAEYDVIVSISTLHFTTDPGKIIQSMKTHTKKMGFNVISVFTKENLDKGFAHLFEQDELRHYYDDWEILHYYRCLSQRHQIQKMQGKGHCVPSLRPGPAPYRIFCNSIALPQSY